MSTIARNGAELIDLLRQRHAVSLQGRPEKQPGSFKTKSNRAGDTRFVDPRHVIGTLKHGHQLIQSLRQPLSRAIYMMFLVSEVQLVS